MKDYMSFWIDEPNLGKWVSDLIIRGRRIGLNGIGVSITVEDGKVSVAPVIPCMGPALRLLKKHPKLTSITFDRKKRKWKPTPGSQV